MKMLYILLAGLSIGLSSISIPSPDLISEETGFREEGCTVSFDSTVFSYTIFDGNEEIGNSIWLDRSSKKVKAKYFPLNPNNQLSPYSKYKKFKVGKKIILLTESAYCGGFSYPYHVGVRVDNGVIINRSYESRMDALVLVYPTGGIVVSNIEDGDLYISDIGQRLDIKNTVDRVKFLRWAEQKKVSVFQTHLLAYKSQSKIIRDNGRKGREKFFLIVKSNNKIFHVLFYIKNGSYSFAQSTNKMLSYMGNKGIELIAMVNFDAGALDIMETSIKNCNNEYIKGTSHQKDNLTNILIYHYDTTGTKF